MLSGAFSCFPCSKNAATEPEVIELSALPQPEATTSNENDVEEQNEENPRNNIYSSKFPPELKLKLIEEMDLATRSSYMKLSKQTFNQVLDSKDYVEKLIIDRGENSVVIEIGNSRSTCSKTIFATDVQNKFLIKYDIDDVKFHELLWLYDSIAKVTKDHFELLTNFKMHNSLTRLEIDMNDFPYNETNIKNLRQINYLDLAVTNNGQNPIDSNFVSFEQICKITDCVGFHWPNLTIDQLFQLQAKTIWLYKITWTSLDFQTILSRCLRQKLSKNVDIIQFNLTEDTIIDHAQIVDGLNPHAKKVCESSTEYLIDIDNDRFPYFSIEISSLEVIISPKVAHYNHGDEKWQVIRYSV